MPFAAVLDANVLYPLPLRDTLLRIAETELYDPYWSNRIQAEVVRNLVLAGRATEGQAARLTAAMDGAFDGAAVPDDAIARLEPAMTNDPNDRHVLAAAVSSDAQAIVTFNLKDFPPEACEPFAIEAIHPDDFLLDLYELAPSVVSEAVDRQAAVLKRPPMKKDELLDRLAVTVPRFRSRAPLRTPMRHGANGPISAQITRRETLVGRSPGRVRVPSSFQKRQALTPGTSSATTAIAVAGALIPAYRFPITMIKITVLYGHPDDPAAFERHFNDVHIPLVNAMPNLRRFEKALVVATSDGSAPPYYRVVELYFDSEEELQASRATPEGRAPGEDVPNYATGGATVLIAVVD